MKNIGIILIVIGVVMMLITGFNFVTHKEVAEIGTMHITQKENHPVQWSPIVGGVLLVAGVVLLLTGKKSN